MASLLPSVTSPPMSPEKSTSKQQQQMPQDAKQNVRAFLSLVSFVSECPRIDINSAIFAVFSPLKVMNFLHHTVISITSKIMY